MLDIDIKQFGELPFQPVTAERATFLLRELPWGEQFVGTSANPAMGNSDIYCYSLNDAFRFLTQGSSRLGSLKGSSRSGMSWIEPSAFLAWLRDYIQDSELADVIEDTLSKRAEEVTQLKANEAASPNGEQDVSTNSSAAKSTNLFAMLGVTGMIPEIPYLEQVGIISECVGMRVVQLEDAIKTAETE